PARRDGRRARRKTPFRLALPHPSERTPEARSRRPRRALYIAKREPLAFRNNGRPSRHRGKHFFRGTGRTARLRPDRRPRRNRTSHGCRMEFSPHRTQAATKRDVRGGRDVNRSSTSKSAFPRPGAAREAPLDQWITACLCPILLPDRTKMFHVKHFGTIGAENLTRPHTSDGVYGVGLRGNLVLLA